MENERRQQLLESEMRAQSLRWWPAWGGDRTFGLVERSAAVLGLTPNETILLTRRWGQDAVFAWTATEWAVLPIADRDPIVSSCRMTVP